MTTQLSTQRDSRPLATVAIVVSIIAIGFSGYVYLQLPEEVSLSELEIQVTSNEQQIDTNKDNIRIGAVALLSLDQSVRQDVSGIRSDLQSAQSDIALNTDVVHRVRIELGHCILLEAEGGRYSFWTSPLFPYFNAPLLPNREAVDRCER